MCVKASKAKPYNMVAEDQKFTDLLKNAEYLRQKLREIEELISKLKVNR